MFRFEQNDAPKFFPNAKEAAEKLVTGIREGKRYQVLVAEMQSGKSSTFFLTAMIALSNEDVENVYIVTGNREKALREQCIEGKTKRINDYVLSEYCNTISNGAKRLLMDSMEDNIHIYWGQELLKSRDIRPRSLVIWEESHTAQSIGNHPDKFFRRNNIDVTGHTADNIYVISVSATPFSEMIDIIRLDQNKHIVRMIPGETYRGIKWYHDHDRIIYTRNESSLDDKLITAMEHHLETHPNLPKWNILRSMEKNFPIIENIARRFQWDVKHHNNKVSHLPTKSMDDLKNSPPRNTLILIKGMCRMGKELHKEHIGFVFETSLSCQSDTVFQSLLGRMCGYKDGEYGYKNNDNLFIYITETVRENVAKYIDFSRPLNDEHDPQGGLPSVVPDNALNVNPIHESRDNRDPNVFYTVPVRIPASVYMNLLPNTNLSMEGITMERLKEELENFMLNPLRRLTTKGLLRPYLLETNNIVQSNEFLQSLDTITPNKLVIRKATIQSSYIQTKVDRTLYTAWENKRVSEWWTDTEKITLIIMDPRYVRTEEHPCSPGDVFICFTTTNTTEEQKQQIEQNQRIPQTTGREVFCRPLPRNQSVPSDPSSGSGSGSGSGSASRPGSGSGSGSDNSDSVGVLQTTIYTDDVTSFIRDIVILVSRIFRDEFRMSPSRSVLRGIRFKKTIYGIPSDPRSVFTRVFCEINAQLKAHFPRSYPQFRQEILMTTFRETNDEILFDELKCSQMVRVKHPSRRL